jgi:predicted anti-sigma-YlaC factor YlaD
MKKISQSAEEMLSDYLDGNLTNADKEKVEKNLQEIPAWRTRYEDLRSVNSALAETVMEQPSKNFTASVMNKLNLYQAPRGLSLWNTVLLLAGVLVAVGITTVLLAGGLYDNSNTSIDLNQIEIPKQIIKTTLPSFEFSGKILVNIVIILNLAIAWIVLDRAILKPFFQRRMQAGH